MRYNKLVIISSYTIEQRTIDLFDIRSLVQKGICVEYWDVGPITYQLQYESTQVEGVSILKFDDRNSFFEYIDKKSRKDSLYLIYMNYAPKTYFCYRALSKRNLDIAYCANGVMPTSPSSIITWKNILAKILKNSINKRTWSLFIFKTIKLTPFLKPLNFQLNTCGKATVDYKVDKNSTFVHFNSTDYNNTKNNLIRVIDGPYYVHIDEYLPFHPDTLISGMEFMDPDLYYSKINYLFDLIERETRKKVIIAAHPIASKYKTQNYYGNRDVIFYKTASLIKYSDGVFNHCSTSMSLAILYNKPIITLLSEDMKSKVGKFYDQCKFTGEFIKSKVINIDHLPDDISFPEIDHDIYDQYKYDYITNRESEDKTNSDILYSILKGNNIPTIR